MPPHVCALLDLGKGQSKILRLLTSEPLSVSELARRTGIPRTTLDYETRKLSKRGLVLKVMRGKQPLWYCDADSIQRKLVDAAVVFGRGVPGRGGGSQDVRDLEVRTYRGPAQIYRLWEQLSDRPRLGRLYSIQPDASFRLAVASLLDTFSFKKLTDINDRLVDNRIIVEALVHERSADSIPNIITAKKMNPAVFLSGFVKRLADTSKLPDNLDAEAEIHVRGDLVAFVFWRENVAVTIKHRDLAVLMKSLFESMKYLSSKYDQNDRFAQKIVALTARRTAIHPKH